MDIETFGGCCPYCSKPMFQKGGDGGNTCLEFDACAFCGFAIGRQSIDEDMEPDAIWTAVLHHHDVSNLAGMRKVAESLTPDDTFFPGVFDYSDMSSSDINGRCRPDAHIQPPP